MVKKLLLTFLLCTWVTLAFGASISTLTDNFNDNSIDAAKWNNTGGGQIVEANQELELSSLTTTQDIRITSQNTYDLTGSGATVKIVDAGNQSLASWKFYFVISDGSVFLYFTIQQSYIGDTLGNWAAYTAETYRYLRIRENSGTLYWDYSSDGNTWSNFSTYSPSSDVNLSVTQVYFQITNTAEASTTTAKIDDFNILPSAGGTASQYSHAFNSGFGEGFNQGVN
jgi:hypothetical protein